MKLSKHREAFAAIAAALLVATPALAQSVTGVFQSPTEPLPRISVAGTAIISVPPDQAQIDAGATTEAKTARDAAEANNATMGKVLLALKAANIDEKDIQTAWISLQPQMAQNHSGGVPAIVGYRASNHVTVRVRDVTKAASTIDLLVGAGATDIGGINFIVSNTSKLLDEARGEAITDARRKAEIYAKAADVTLGEPLSIAEGSAGGPPSPFRAMGVAMPAAATIPIAQGEQMLRVTVNVSWAIKPTGQ